MLVTSSLPTVIYVVLAVLLFKKTDDDNRFLVKINYVMLLSTGCL